MAFAADMPPHRHGRSRLHAALAGEHAGQPERLQGQVGGAVLLPEGPDHRLHLEAHNFQRDLPKYEALNAVVLGVTLDTVESHKTWCTKDTFTFKLLADPDHKVVDAYGVPVKRSHRRRPISFAMRDTFLISPEGKIVKMWEVKDIDTHSDEVLAAIQAKK